MLTLGGSVRRRIGSLEVEIYLQFVSVSNVCVLKVFHVIKCPFQCFVFESFFLLVYSKLYFQGAHWRWQQQWQQWKGERKHLQLCLKKILKKTKNAEENGKNTEQNTYNFVWGIKRNLFVIFSSKFNNKNTLNLIWQFKSNKETFSFNKNITQSNKQGNWNNCSPFETKINAQVQNIVKKKILLCIQWYVVNKPGLFL